MVDLAAFPESALKEAGNKHILMHGSAYQALATDLARKSSSRTASSSKISTETSISMRSRAYGWSMSGMVGKKSATRWRDKRERRLCEFDSSNHNTRNTASCRLAEITPGDQTTAFVPVAPNRSIRDQDLTPISLS